MNDATMTKQVLLTHVSRTYWRVTFDHPPLNIFGPETIPQLNEVITAIENDESVKVVVFDSAVEGAIGPPPGTSETKRLVDLNSLPPDENIGLEWDAFLASLARPATQRRIRELFRRGFHAPGDVETRLGYHV